MRVSTLLFSSLLMLVLTGCAELSGEGDIQFNEYISFQDASRRGAFKSGWLPRALPESTTSIVESHNVDSNEVWITFRYSKDEIDELLKGCVVNPRARFPTADRTKRSAPWWPAGLIDGSGEQSRKQLMVFSCPSMRHAESLFAASIAVDRTSRIAWYWIAQ